MVRSGGPRRAAGRNRDEPLPFHGGKQKKFEPNFFPSVPAGKTSEMPPGTNLDQGGGVRQSHRETNRGLQPANRFVTWDFPDAA